jgi:Na+/H+-dicarboxylate symporter
MLFGILLGLTLSHFKPTLADKLSLFLESLVNKLLNVLTLAIPIFVMGFIVKLQYDKVLEEIIKDYTTVFIIVAFTQFGYISALYFITNNLSISRLLVTLKNMLPAAITGFSTMSSVAAMPLTLIGVKKNSNNPLAASVIPATVNIHLIGDCLAIPIFAYAILKNYGIAEPSLANYMIFAFYFIIAKFSVAAVPGGGIIVMLPILEKYLGFNADMMSLITALYILFDPA